jgi:hypothetical protein
MRFQKVNMRGNPPGRGKEEFESKTAGGAKGLNDACPDTIFGSAFRLTTRNVRRIT